MHAKTIAALPGQIQSFLRTHFVKSNRQGVGDLMESYARLVNAAKRIQEKFDTLTQPQIFELLSHLHFSPHMETAFALLRPYLTFPPHAREWVQIRMVGYAEFYYGCQEPFLAESLSAKNWQMIVEDFLEEESRQLQRIEEYLATKKIPPSEVQKEKIKRFLHLWQEWLLAKNQNKKEFLAYYRNEVAEMAQDCGLPLKEAKQLLRRVLSFYLSENEVVRFFGEYHDFHFWNAFEVVRGAALRSIYNMDQRTLAELKIPNFYSVEQEDHFTEKYQTLFAELNAVLDRYEYPQGLEREKLMLHLLDTLSDVHLHWFKMNWFWNRNLDDKLYILFLADLHTLYLQNPDIWVALIEQAQADLRTVRTLQNYFDPRVP